MEYNKIIYKGNILVDLTKDNVTEADVAKGKRFHKPNGEVGIGTSEGGGSAPAVLGEITINKNGIYEPTASVELGGTYKFKDDYTDEELETLLNTTEFFVQSNEMNIWIEQDPPCKWLKYEGQDFWFMYLTEKNSTMYYGADGAGWYNASTMEKIATPTVTLPTDASAIKADQSIVSSLFVLPDGYNKINVNVEPELDEITITKNGVYEATANVEYGGTYTFKEVIDEEFLSKNVLKSTTLATFNSNIHLIISNRCSSMDAFVMRYGNYAYIYKLGTNSSLYGVDAIGWYEINWDMPIVVFTKTSAPTITDTLLWSAPSFSIELLRSCIEEGNIELNVESTFTFKSDLSHINWEQFSDFKEERMGFIEWFDDSFMYCQPEGDSYTLQYKQYNYLTEKNAAAYSMPEFGWYDVSGDNPVKVSAPIITLPSSSLVDDDSGSAFMVYPQELSEFFDIVLCDGYNKVTVDVQGTAPVLEELAITKNGVYEAVQGIELGNTYTFKDTYTNDELKMLYECGQINGNYSVFIEDQDNNMGLAIADVGNGLYGLEYRSLMDQSWGFIYATKELVEVGMFSRGGWLYFSIFDPSETPTITIPTNASAILVDPSSLAPFFGIVPCDGYNKVTVDIPLGELKITNNGIYEPVSSVEPGGTYTFKDSYTDAELAEIFGMGRISGSHSYIAETPFYSLSVAMEEYNGVTRYGIYAPDALYVGEEASKAYTNGIPGWYAYSANQPCSETPTISIPSGSATINVNLPAFSKLISLLKGYNKIVVDVQGTADPVLEELEVTENGEYTPNEADGYSKVVVAVKNVTSIAPVDVMTEAEMTELLVSGQQGGVYRYMGTTGTYERGELYLLEEVGDENDA